MYCPTCGTLNENGRKYCAQCGTQLSTYPLPYEDEEKEFYDAVDEEYGRDEEDYKEEKPANRTALYVIIAVAVLALIAAVLFIGPKLFDKNDEPEESEAVESMEPGEHNDGYADYDKLVAACVKNSLEDTNSVKLAQLFYNDDMLISSTNGKANSASSARSFLQNRYEDFRDEIDKEFDPSWSKVSVSFDVEDQVSDNGVDALNREYKDTYGYDLGAKAIATVKLTVKYAESGNEFCTVPASMRIVSIEGNWFVLEPLKLSGSDITPAIVGKWSGSVDVTNHLKKSDSFKKLADDTGFDINTVKGTVSVSFVMQLNSDGTYKITVDEAATKNASSSFFADFRSKFVDFAVEICYQTFEEKGWSREEADIYVTGEGYADMEEYAMEDIDLSGITAEAFVGDLKNESGYYKTDNGKIYLAVNKGSFGGNNYLSYTRTSKTNLKITGIADGVTGFFMGLNGSCPIKLTLK